MLEREGRASLALPVPRQACLGLTRAVLFFDFEQRVSNDNEKSWQIMWDFAGKDPSVAICLMEWERCTGVAGRSPVRWLVDSLVLSDDVRSGRVGGAEFLTEASWSDFLATADIGAQQRLPGNPHQDQDVEKLVGAVLAGDVDGLARAFPPASVVEPSLEATVLRDAVSAAVALDVSAQRFDDTVRESRLAAMRELAYGAGHEINNPLANIAARAQALLLDEVDPERRRRLATIVDQAFRARDMIGGLMVFARPPRPQPSLVELGSLVAEVIENAKAMAGVRSARLEYVAPGETVEAWVDGAQVAEAIRALVINALEAVDPGGNVTLSLEAIQRGGPGSPASSVVKIIDNGRGMDEETARRALDPFFSGREAGRGIGLGLSKAWRLIDTNGGVLELETQMGCGTCVMLRLPESAPERASVAR
ncbi:MAG: ATP-binding protein [Pirellulales bacterium]